MDDSKTVRAIVTMPPYAEFAGEVARHPLVAGFRINTVMPIERDDPGPVLDRFAAFGVPVWIDLKARQLRVVGGAVPPFTEVTLSHAIRVKTPTTAYFADGRESARVLRVDGKRLILADGPRRYIGPGESVNIPDASLVIDGTLTAMDRAWLEAMRARGDRRVMLSFAERVGDADVVRELLPDAELVLKIESLRGVGFAMEHRTAHGRLMAARGDLYVEVAKPADILTAVREIVRADSDAIAASRIFTSLARRSHVEAADVSDVAFLHGLGYRTFMLGDEVCLRRESVIAALDALSDVAEACA